MEQFKKQLGTIIIAFAVIIAVWVAASAYRYKFQISEIISVTGLAEKDFTSDLIVWSGSFSRTGVDLKNAYAELKQDEAAIKSYLNSKGIADSSIVFASVSTNKNFQSQYNSQGVEIGSVFTGYTLTGSVRVESGDILRVEKLSREITELLEKGIELNSFAPQYYYTKLNELKIDLLAQASADAKTRAQTIANNSGGGLGQLRKAGMGVFQITGKNANEDYSYGGVFNTSSKEKTASVTLKAEYGVR
jgi:hypothetical protein